MPLLLHTFGEVPRKTVESVAAFCAVAQEVADVRHRIAVRLLATDTIFSNGRCDGVFYFCDSRAEIFLAGLTKNLLSTLAHEIGHYQQWRDGEDASNEPDAILRGAEIQRLVKRGRR